MTGKRFGVLNQLWAAGIKAETSYKDNPKANNNINQCLEEQTPLMIFIGEDEINA